MLKHENLQGDSAVVFPCSMFNKSSANDVFCFRYVSTSIQGLVHTVASRCVGGRDNGQSSHDILSSVVRPVISTEPLYYSSVEVNCEVWREDYNSPEYH